MKYLPVLFILCLPAAAQETLKLDSVLSAIERNNPALKMYDDQIKAYEAYASGARSQMAPQIGAGFFMTPYNSDLWKPGSMTSTGMGMLMFSGRQMFTNPAKLRANEQYMRGMTGVEEAEKSAMRNELFSMAKMEYYEWLVLKRKLRTLNESEALMEYILKTTEVGYTYGMTPLASYYKAKAMLGDVRQMKLMAEQEIEQRRIALNTLMYRDRNTPFDIDTVYELKNYEAALTDTAALAAARSDYRSLENQVTTLELQQRYERTLRLPDFGIQYDHMMTFGAQPQMFSLMAMVSLPLAPWSSKMYRANSEGLSSEMAAVQNQQLALLNEAGGEVLSIQAQLKSGKQQLELYEKAILPAMERNYRAQLTAYETNTGDLFEALDAWQNLNLTKMSYLDLLNTLLQLQARYEQQMEIR